MSEEPAPRGPVQGLVDLARFLERPQGMSTFLRGLVVGAFVGAALAGSAMVRRRGRQVGRSSSEGPSAGQS